MKKLKKIILVLIVIALIATVVALTTNIVMSKVDKKANPVVTMEIEGYGNIKIELYPNMAPNTVKNFIRLAQRGFYNGRTFSDVQDSLIVGGLDVKDDKNVSTTTDDSEDTSSSNGPKLSNMKDLGEGEQDKQYSIKGEFVENGFNDNTLSHERGVISMSRKSYSQYQQEIAMVQMMGYSSYVDTLVEQMYDSQSCGFFILTEDDTRYDGTYSAFGRVIEGMDVVDSISKLEVKKTTSDDGTNTTSTEIVNAPVIKNMSVETYGVEYGEPETVDMFDFDAIFNMFMQNYMQQSSSTSSVLE